MDMNRLTEKAREAVHDAQNRALALSHQQVDVEHLLASLLDQERGLAGSILIKADIGLANLKARLRDELESRPKVTGSGGVADQIFVTGRLNLLMATAEQEAKALRDEFISVEHFLIAIIDDDGPAGKLFKELGLTRDRLMSTLREVRGSQRVTSDNPEATYEALSQYGQDLTEAARTAPRPAVGLSADREPRAAQHPGSRSGRSVRKADSSFPEVKASHAIDPSSSGLVLP